jgi:hypothetical protein
VLAQSPVPVLIVRKEPAEVAAEPALALP